MGYEGVKAIVSTIKGQPVPKHMDTGVALITKASLDDPAIKQLLQLQ
jgi:ABC-type sugar transport system substrate-binding protein